ncbi:MAG: YIP1 family protein [Candidatus Nanohaloarchaea archaeon]
MSLIDDWADTFKEVLTSPSEFYESEQRRDGFGFPLKFALINLVISGVIGAIAAGVLGTATSGLAGTPAVSGPILGIVTLVVTPIFGLIGLFISAALVHVFVVLLGGESGYRETLAVIEYASAISPITSLFSLIPVLGGLANVLVGIYAIFIQSKGVQLFKSMSFGRALGAVLLPAVVILLLVVVLVVIFMSAAFASLAAA